MSSQNHQLNARQLGPMLMEASVKGNITQMKELLAQGVPPNYRTLGGVSTLVVATARGNLEMLRILFGAGADVNIQDDNGNTALMISASSDNLEVVQALIEFDTDLDIQNRWGETALMVAAKNDKLEIFKILLRNGADIDLQNKQGKTAYELTGNIGIKNLITERQIAKKNIETLEDLRTNRFTYLFVIPKDLITLVKNELRIVYF